MSKNLILVVIVALILLGCQKPMYGLYRNYQLGSYEPSVICFQAAIESVEGVGGVKYKYELENKLEFDNRIGIEIWKERVKVNLPEHIHKFTYSIGEFENSVILEVDDKRLTKYYHYLISENKNEADKMVQDYRGTVLKIEKALEESCGFRGVSKQPNLICDVDACRR